MLRVQSYLKEVRKGGGCRRKNIRSGWYKRLPLWMTSLPPAPRGRKEHVLVVCPHAGQELLDGSRALRVLGLLFRSVGEAGGGPRRHGPELAIGHPLREARGSCSAGKGFGQWGGYSNPGTGKYLRHSARESPEDAGPGFLPSGPPCRFGAFLYSGLFRIE